MNTGISFPAEKSEEMLTNEVFSHFLNWYHLFSFGNVSVQQREGILSGNDTIML
jgi:hypothetical protein